MKGLGITPGGRTYPSGSEGQKGDLRQSMRDFGILR